MNPFRGLTEDQHCTGNCAKDAGGHMTHTTGEEAVQWCAFGILLKAEATQGLEIDRFIDWIRTKHGKWIASINDMDRKPFSWFADEWDEFEKASTQ